MLIVVCRFDYTLSSLVLVLVALVDGQWSWLILNHGKSLIVVILWLIVICSWLVVAGRDCL